MSISLSILNSISISTPTPLIISISAYVCIYAYILYLLQVSIWIFLVSVPQVACVLSGDAGIDNSCIHQHGGAIILFIKAKASGQ